MSIYVADHASALADVTEAGASADFTRTTMTTDESTGNVTPSPTTIYGFAIQEYGQYSFAYQALGLVESDGPVLFWVPVTMGNRPTPGDTTTWGGNTYTVAKVAPLAIDGTAIAAGVQLSR